MTAAPRRPPGKAQPSGFKKEEHPMVKKLDIKDRDQVEKINELATQTPYEVWLSTDTLMLDARSLLGLYALIGKRVNVVTEDSVDPRSLDRLVDKMS